MVASAVGRVGRLRRPVRHVAAGAALVGAVVAANAAIGLANGGADGRDGSTVPGPPVDDGPSAPVDLDAGRGGAATPGVAAQPGSAPLAASADVTGPVDNGRGGVDPALGPNPAASAEVTRVADRTLASGEVDTDSGRVEARNANLDRRSSNETESEPGDQDVPGASTDGPPGEDLPSNDTDG